MADNVFDQIHKESSAPPGNVFEQLHAENSGGGASQASAAGDFARGAWSKMNPMEMIRGMGDTAKAFGEHPIDTALTVLAHPYSALQRTKEALHAGKFEEAAAHLHSALNPAGFLTEDSQVKGATPGHRASGFGEMLGTGLAAYLGAKAPDAAAGVKNAASSTADLASQVLAHPKVASAIKDAVIEFGKEIPGVKTALKVGKAAGAAKDVLSDINAPRPVEAQPPPMPSATPAAAAAAPAPEPAPSVPASHITSTDGPPRTTELLNMLRSQLEESGALRKGYHLGEEPHGSYPDRFDVGSNAPTIRSTEPAVKFNKGIAPDSALAKNPKALELAMQLAQELKSNP